MSIDGRNVSLRLWTEKEKFSQLDLAYRLVPQIMETLENYIGIPYSLPKLDMVSHLIMFYNNCNNKKLLLKTGLTPRIRFSPSHGKLGINCAKVYTLKLIKLDLT